MREVQPGNATGLFYIIVAGLPWNCSWQRLKDFSRNNQSDGSYTEIDHAHVYPDETNGWVRVKGKANFTKAMENLTNGILDHRSLVVDGRNETDVTSIKEDEFGELGGYGETLPVRSRNDSSSSFDSFPPPSVNYYNHYNTTSTSAYSGSENWFGIAQPSSTVSIMPPVLPTTYYQPTPHVYETINPISPYISPPIPPNVVYAGNMAPTTPVFVTPVPHQPIYTYTAAAPYMEAATFAPTDTISVKAELRKIVITQLPRSTSYHSLQTLVIKYITRGMPRSSANSPLEEICELKIVTHPDKKSRGHAFAVLKSDQIARSVIKGLDGLKFEGRIIKARFAKEGIDSAEYTNTSDLRTILPQQYQCLSSETSSTYSREKLAKIEAPAQRNIDSSNHEDRGLAIVTPRSENRHQLSEKIAAPSTHRDIAHVIAHSPTQRTVKTLCCEDRKSKRDSKGGSHEREPSKKITHSPMVANGSSISSHVKRGRNRDA